MPKKFLHDIEIISSAEGTSGLSLPHIKDGEKKNQDVTILAHDDETGEVVRFDASNLATTANSITQAKAQEIVTNAINGVKQTEAGKYTGEASTANGNKIGSIKDINGATHDVKETITTIPEFSFSGTTLTLKYKNESGNTETKTADLAGLVTVDVNLDTATFDTATKVLTLRETDGDVKTVNLGAFNVVAEAGTDGEKTIKQNGETLFTLPNFDKITAQREVHSVALTANQDKAVQITMTAPKYILQVFDADGNEVEMGVKQSGKTVTLNSTVSGTYTLVVL